MANDTQRVKPGRLEHIDACRFIAAMSVVLMHTLGFMARSPSTEASLRSIIETTLSTFDFGRFGVVLFFLISGYVIPFSLAQGQSLKRFIVGRFFRLYPAFWVSVMIFSAISFNQGDFSIGRVLANATMIPQAFGQKALSGVYWTLSVELVFYALCAALFFGGFLRIGQSYHLPILILLLTSGGSSLSHHFLGIGRPIYLLNHLVFLLLGFQIRTLVANFHWRSFSALCALCVAQLATVWWLAIDSAVGQAFVNFTPEATTLSSAVALLFFGLALLLHRTRFPRLATLGQSSYSLYLFHWPVNMLLATTIPPNSPLSAIALLVLTMSISQAIAFIGYRFIEHPFSLLARQ